MTLELFSRPGMFIQPPHSQELILGRPSEADRAPSMGQYNWWQKKWNFFNPIRTYPIKDLIHARPMQLDYQQGQDFDTEFKQDFDELKNNWPKHLKKIVLYSAREYENFDQGQLPILLSNLLQFSEGYLYGVWNEGGGLLGCTPELLTSLDEGVFNFYALAGTSTDQETLKRDAKLKDEQNFVQQDLKDKLGALVHKEDTWPKFGNYFHHQTLLSKFFQGENLVEMVEKISPTAAIGGYPSNLALDYLKKTHYQKNASTSGAYGSSLGLWKEGRGFFLVGIRNIQWRGKRLWIENGCGILPDSRWEREYEEMLLKRKSVEKIFNFKVCS